MIRDHTSYFNLKQHLSHPVFKIISEVADALKTPSFVVGGYVRDIILKRESKDIDIVVLGDGIQVARQVALHAGKNTRVSVFRNFGTAMVRYKDLEIEFVGARKESYKEHSRKPFVVAGTLSEDQKRRDFTINAMAISLSSDSFGELIDPFGGVADLAGKIIRTPEDADITYSDDPLRMMRAIRFASQLGFRIDELSYNAIVRNRERIKIVSMERISEEINKIILSPIPSTGFKLMFNTGLLHLIFPEMAALHGVDIINNKGHKDNFYHTLEVLDNISKKTNDLWLRWAAILHDIAKPLTKRFDQENGWTFHGHEDKGARMIPFIFRKLKLPLNEKMKFVQKLVKLHLRPIALTKEEVTDSAIRRLLFDAGDEIDALMTLCHADITSKNELKVKKYIRNFQYVQQKLHEVEEKDKLRNWQPPITGDEIMSALNLRPGNQVGLIKNAIREAILEGEINNDHHEAIKFMYEKALKEGTIDKLPD